MAKEFKILQRQFAQSIRYPDQEISGELGTIEDRRLKIYRELFFNNIESFISGTFPVLKSIIDEEVWLQLIRTFFQKHSADTPYFLEISEEFLTFLQANRDAIIKQGIHLPEYALELAHWEWMELLADRADYHQDYTAPINTIDLDLRYTVQEAVWGVSYQYPVHKAAVGVEIQPELTCLLIYRNQQDQVGFVEVNPLSLLLFERLQSNRTKPLLTILGDIAEESNLDSNQVTSGGLHIMEQWKDLTILKAITF
ncbi:DUF2063 domain-containing protein [Bermanella marisrubri]|uniref:Uncharacterized protein n=1 Tax=Bermanella marisrubri TaxID=207949 RepID=Q1N0N9_9GAMM|nr:DUF2063 domain-containing protein [Bermanella marisrubri]EAT11794.1 hypothetical protein RED65_05389 [Oceanobacter sp. RED65] [Bermanella marisrubri]QIZ83829.1 DUF2063 domain-containing protein [Bermanella marisrubri]